MKKIILLSFFMMSSSVLTSCTADSIADSTPPSTTVNADDTGGQGIPPPPKPPGTGTGTGTGG